MTQAPPIEVEAVEVPTNALRSTKTTTNYNAAPDKFEQVIADLPEDQQEIIRWCYFLGKDNEWSFGTLAKNVGVSTTTLSRVFRGQYGAELTGFCETLTKARASLSEAVDNPEFILTSLANEIFTICDRVRALRTVAILWGVMGIGKTAGLEEYKTRNNHGKTIYYRCEPGMTLVQFITSFAAACGIRPQARLTQLRTREKLYSVLGGGQRLVIIDELHQLFIRPKSRGTDVTPVLQCEFLRTVFDKAKCGFVLVGTEALQKFMDTQKEALEQLMDRGTMTIYLPDKPTQKDIALFISAFGLPALSASEPKACAIVADILKSSGLRKLTLHLRDGAATAAKAKEKYTWTHFCTAFADLQSICKKRK